MFNSVTNTKLNLIIEITEKLEHSSLSQEVIEDIKDELKDISDYLNVNEECALFFSIIFAIQNKNFNAVTLQEIAEFLDYPFLQVLQFRYLINELEANNLITTIEGRGRNSDSNSNGYKITDTIMNNVIDGKPIAKVEKEKVCTESILDNILCVQSLFADDEFNSIEYKRRIINLENKYSDNVMVSNINSLFADDFESRVILYNLCCPLVMGQEFRPNRRSDEESSSIFTILPSGAIFKRRSSFKDGNDILMEKGLVEKYFAPSESSFRRGNSTVITYKITREGIKTIFGDEAKKYLNDVSEESETDRTYSAIKELAYEFETSKSYPIKLRTLNLIEERHEVLPFIKKLKKVLKNKEARYFLYSCINDYMNGCISSLSITVGDLYGKSEKYFKVLRQFVEETHPLLKGDFLEIFKEDIVEKTSLRITDRTIELLYGKNADIYKMSSKSKNVLQPGDLKEKTLFYSNDVQSQIDMLTESMKQENLEAMQKRLEDKGLCKGIAVILYGAPGTGKTETVYQLAKKTNRQILHVDIADSKSMWFGESEKQIKKIFTSYKSLCRNCKSHHENTPILLFNEADAIISKRKDVGYSSVNQTENAMQNILLEEMEKLEGILIATTNLCDNMDSAFERRFLFKVKYEKPSVEARCKIWSSKLNFLEEEDLNNLARQFDFSGGEIDNIVRKCELNEIITGKKASYEDILDYCHKEKLSREETHQMGFAV